jgi:hypothetical protein
VPVLRDSQAKVIGAGARRDDKHPRLDLLSVVAGLEAALAALVERFKAVQNPPTK